MPDTGDSDLYLSDVSPKDKPWDIHRAIATEIEMLYGMTDLNRYARRMHECSKLLGFGFQPQEDGLFRLKLRKASFCRVRHCPICQWRKCLMWRARFFQALPNVIKDYPKYRFIFLTFTVKNCPLQELRATISHMNKSWERLSKRKVFPGVGWVRSVEVTRAENDEAHPHFHCLLMVRPSYFSTGYLPHAEWVSLWKHALRINYDPGVKVQVIKNKHESAAEEKDLVPVRGILETMKYTIKPQDLLGKGNDDPAVALTNADWLSDLTDQLRGTRSISVGGVFRNYLSEDEPEDLINTEDEEVTLTEDDLEVWFGWREMVKRYRKI